VNQDDTDIVLSGSSYHVGGMHVLMCDGAVRFVSENIDTGNLAAAGVLPSALTTTITGPSPYGVWGALGTRAGNDTVGNF
jgi:prepilin-type processing-associated H-X9-DG protein